MKDAQFDPANTPLIDGQFNYIKLHGSANWRAPGGRAQMVIGTGKQEQIAGNALLAWYLSVFERVLTAGGVSLMTIGYGYADEHTNRVIGSAYRNNGLRLFAWNAGCNPLELVRTALGAGIIPLCEDKPLTEIFPPDQSRPIARDNIFRTFFGA